MYSTAYQLPASHEADEDVFVRMCNNHRLERKRAAALKDKQRRRSARIWKNRLTVAMVILAAASTANSVITFIQMCHQFNLG